MSFIYIVLHFVLEERKQNNRVQDFTFFSPRIKVSSQIIFLLKKKKKKLNPNPIFYPSSLLVDIRRRLDENTDNRQLFHPLIDGLISSLVAPQSSQCLEALSSTHVGLQLLTQQLSICFHLAQEHFLSFRGGGVGGALRGGVFGGSWSESWRALEQPHPFLSII